MLSIASVVLHAGCEGRGLFKQLKLYDEHWYMIHLCSGSCSLATSLC